MLKTAAFGLGFQHLPRDLANVNAWKTMFDPYISNTLLLSRHIKERQEYKAKSNTIKDIRVIVFEDRTTYFQTSQNSVLCHGIKS